MRILVTGATGFIGSHLVPKLVGRDHEVFCTCRDEAAVPFGSSLVWNGTGSFPEENFPASIDAVVHLAQSRAYRTFPADEPEMFNVNVRMTAELLRWAAKLGVKHFVLASSGAVYEPFSGRLQEDSPLAPTSFLGATKYAAEILAGPYATKFNLSVLRLFFPYGPGQRDRLIPDLIGGCGHSKRSRSRRTVRGFSSLQFLLMMWYPSSLSASKRDGPVRLTLLLPKGYQ